MARILVNPYRQPATLWQDPFFNQAFNWVTSNSNTATTFRVNVYQDENNFYVYGYAPNASADKFDISMLENKLTIAGETLENRFAPEGEGITALHTELSAVKPGKFQRTLTLPASVSADDVVANFENGVLKLTLPKVPQAKARRITVGQPQTVEA